MEDFRLRAEVVGLKIRGLRVEDFEVRVEIPVFFSLRLGLRFNLGHLRFLILFPESAKVCQ